MKTRGGLQLAGGIEEYLDDVASRISVIPITTRIAMLAAQFPQDYSTDPCDRIIAATALAQSMLLLTKDERMRACRQASNDLVTKHSRKL